MQQLRPAPAASDLLERLEQPFGRTAIGLEHEDVVVLVEPVTCVIKLEMAGFAIVLDSDEDNLVIVSCDAGLACFIPPNLAANYFLDPPWSEDPR
jgi:hypothetical protein